VTDRKELRKKIHVSNLSTTEKIGSFIQILRKFSFHDIERYSVQS